MRVLALALVASFAASAAPSQEARALQEQGRSLLAENRFGAALDKLEAANRLESSPELLVAIARCHRELAVQSLIEAARARPTEQVMRSLAASLDELEAVRDSQPPPEEPSEMAAAGARQTTVPAEPVQAPRRTEIPALAAQAPQPQAAEREPAISRKTAVAATGIAAAVLLAASGAAWLHGSSLAAGLNDPGRPDKSGLQGEVRAWQAGSNMLLGAGLFLGAVTAGLFAVRF